MHNLCTDNKMISLMLVVGHSSADDQQQVCVGCGPCKGDVDGRISSGRGHMPCHRPYAHTGWAIRSSRGLLKAREGLNGPARHILLYDPSTSHIIEQERFKFVHIILCHLEGTESEIKLSFNVYIASLLNSWSKGSFTQNNSENCGE